MERTNEKTTDATRRWSHNWQSRWSHHPGKNQVTLVPSSWQTTLRSRKSVHLKGFRDTLRRSGRRPVDGWGGVKCESFNASLKREILQDRSQWPDAATCRREVFRWLVRYNLKRRHSRCRYSSPAGYENTHTFVTLPEAA
ncbi:hypothetical protein C1S79_01350 [Mycolicibacterium phocaicum]|uniref:Integrase catalytic domain-containing protein n=1 Tax=Mycolicibacterium phocaicum TaxID=319706 RepID=A0AA94UHJ5_9MYCO|nr:hypothetical protein C1S79_01350 [Mycolicibacterium phocaicum]